MTTNTAITGVIKPDSNQQQPESVVATGFDQVDKYIGSNMVKLFGRKTATTGLTWHYHGGSYNLDGAFVSIADGTVALTASSTNYVETTRAGTVSKNTTGFSADKLPLYEVVTDTVGITAETDRRDWLRSPLLTILAKSMTSDANVTLTSAETRVDVIHVTSTVSLTVTRDIIIPLIADEFTVYNNTTGNQALRVIGASGAGVLVQPKQRLRVYCDGTNVVPSITNGVSQSIAYAATIAIDASLGDRVLIGALTGALTMNAPTNPSRGQKLTIYLLQDATGGRVTTWNAVFKKAADGAGTANQKGVTEFLYDGTDWVQIGGPLVFL